MLPSSTTSLVLSSVSSSFFLNSQAHGNTRLRQRLKPYQTIPALPMATEEPAIVSQEPQATPKIPDYLASPNSVFGDEGVAWRYGRAPDYTKTRKEWVEGKTMNHAPGSLEEMVENLIKNWEVEASFKPRLSDWRTIDHENYSFAMGGGPPKNAEHMIRVGTYNGIITPNEYYSPENSDFASSHKTFKRMMPTFAWEVLEVYSGPPRVSFRWRHWGVMKNDYTGFNDKGEKVTAKAHGGVIDIEGVTVAGVDDKIRLRDVQTWMDPLEMFRQIAPHGVVNKATMNRKVDKEAALDVDHESAEIVPEAAEVKNTSEPASVSQDTTDIKETSKPEHVSQPEETVKDASESKEVSQPEAGVKSESQDEHAYLGMTATSATNTQQTPSRPVTAAVTEPLSNVETDSQAHNIVESAAEQGADREIEIPPSNAPAQTAVIEPTSYQTSTKTPTITSETEARASTDAADVTRSIYSSSITGNVEDVIKASQSGQVVDESKTTGNYDQVDKHLDSSADLVHPHPKDVEKSVQPEAGEAVAVGEQSEETRLTHEEMSTFTAGECPFLMNRE